METTGRVISHDVEEDSGDDMVLWERENTPVVRFPLFWRDVSFLIEQDTEDNWGMIFATLIYNIKQPPTTTTPHHKQQQQHSNREWSGWLIVGSC